MMGHRDPFFYSIAIPKIPPLLSTCAVLQNTSAPAQFERARSALAPFLPPESRILWLRMTRGSGKLCRTLAKIWLFGPHGACS